METIKSKKMSLEDIELEIKKEFIKCELFRITEGSTICTNKVLDALDELMQLFANNEDYELAQVVKEFKVDLVMINGYLKEDNVICS